MIIWKTNYGGAQDHGKNDVFTKLRNLGIKMHFKVALVHTSFQNWVKSHDVLPVDTCPNLSTAKIVLSHMEKYILGVPIMAQRKQIQLVSMRMWVRSLASLSGSGIRLCCELWCKSHTWLGSFIAVAVAVAVASSCSSDSTPSLGNSICHGYGPKK